MSSLSRVRFEVFGRVQGVFFRKYTKKRADALALSGWVRNTSVGSVEGLIMGPKENVEMMQEWLRNEGSPQSRIDRAVFEDLDHSEDQDTHQQSKGFQIRQ